MADFKITSDQVHVWNLSLKDTPSETEELYQSLLSEDELERAQKLRFKEDRHRFITARGNLRLLLSKYLNKKPRQLWIRYGRHGKPYLSEESNPKRINFNLSHSQDTVLYAFTKSREVGIDIEHQRPVSRSDKIIERFFSEEEIAYYNSAEMESKHERFFKLWCAREAYSKAIGSGVYLPRDKIDISFVSGKSIQKSLGDNIIPEVSIYELEAERGYTAYLAVSGKEPEIITRDIKSVN